MFIQVTSHLETQPAHRAEAFHQLRVVAGNVLLEIMSRGETHTTGFAFKTHAMQMVDIEMFLRVDLFLEDDVAMTTFECFSGRVLSRDLVRVERRGMFLQMINVLESDVTFLTLGDDVISA